MFLQKVFEALLAPHNYTKSQYLMREKVITLNIVMLIMGSVLFSFAIVRFFEHNYIQSFFDTMLFVIIVLSYLRLYNNMYSILFISRFLILFAIITTLVLIVFSPEVDTRFVWVSICVYMMFFLLDLKEGVLWFLSMSVLFMALYFIGILHVSISEFAIFFISTAMLALLLTRYEKIKEKSENRYAVHAQELQNAVNVKTNELRAQKEMFETLFQKSYDGILLLENKNFIECNDAVVRMLGYNKKEELLQQHPSKLSPKYQADGSLSSEKAEEMMQLCLQNGAHNFEWIHQKANGINFWCDVTLTHLTFQNKDIIHAVWRDISKQKVLELENIKINDNLEKEVKKRTYELEVAMRAKSDFLANMSHEIRTPLNAILGFIDILKKDERDATRKEYLDIIQNSGKGLLTIINDILDFSKIQSGKLELETSSFETIKPFEEVQLLFYEKAKEKNISCRIDLLSTLPEMLLGDTVRIKQTVSNILSNAVKFTPQGGSIVIELSYDFESHMLHCSVEDNGIGISKENVENIFTSFTQADATTTRKFGGTGLGLSISKQLVELMGGTIKVDAKAGYGSKFSFSFAVEPVDDLKLIEPLNGDTMGQHLCFDAKALIVEDNKTNQMLLKIMLEEFDIEVDISENGLEALQKVQNFSYNLILMDENMPIMNGMESSRQIRKLNIDTPIVAVTANALKGDREKYLEAGMDDYLSKPIDSAEFKDVLLKFLKPKKHDENSIF